MSKGDVSGRPELPVSPATPARGKTLEAEGFVHRDKGGKMRGALEVVDDEPGLTLYDKEGRPRATKSNPVRERERRA
jgi:hypothetical protein